MKKILFIVYYEIIDYLIPIKELLEDFHFIVISYPLFRYAYDQFDKITNYTEHLNEFIKTNEIDIILWWFIDVPLITFNYIKKHNKDVFLIMHNADDPLNLNDEMFKKASIFDMVITPCRESTYKYKIYSECKHVIYNEFGYDPKIFFNKNIKEEIDLTMICYNICHLEFIKETIEYSKKNNKIFKLYGSGIYKEEFPNNYVSDIGYYNLNNLYNSSKLVLITNKNDIQSVYQSGANYLTEFDEDKINILLNSKSQHHIKHHNWLDWVKKIVVQIGIIYFDENIYKLNDIETDDLLKHWKEHGIHKKLICYDFKVPNNFNSEEYINKFNLDKVEPTCKKAYLHWIYHSKDMKFMKKEHSHIKFGIDTLTNEQLFELFTLFNKHDINGIGNYIQQYPLVDINEVLDKYLKLTY